jgi:adenosylcobinamide-phosphate synthase
VTFRWPGALITARSVCAHRAHRPHPGPPSYLSHLGLPGLAPGRRPGLAPGRRPGLPLAAGLLAGVALDSLLGDPRRHHPVAGFGQAAAALERRLYAPTRPRGALYTAACVLLAAAPAALASRLTRRHPLARGAAVAITVWAVTGGRSLRSEAAKTAAALDRSDLPAARAQLSALCSRDPTQLGPKEIARAVVESLAENTSDAVVGPLVWGALAGLPGLAVYRAVNTLDAMVGYRSPRYAEFGWAAARLDDVLNWAPARLTAALTAACAPLSAGDPVQAWHTARRDGGRHPSPNAGRPEAAFAGALGLRLGGASQYHGVTEHRPELGDGRPPEPSDVGRAQRLSLAVTLAAAALAAAAAALPGPSQ